MAASTLGMYWRLRIGPWLQAANAASSPRSCQALTNRRRQRHSGSAASRATSRFVTNCFGYSLILGSGIGAPIVLELPGGIPDQVGQLPGQLDGDGVLADRDHRPDDVGRRGCHGPDRPE